MLGHQPPSLPAPQSWCRPGWRTQGSGEKEVSSHLNSKVFSLQLAKYTLGHARPASFTSFQANFRTCYHKLWFALQAVRPHPWRNASIRNLPHWPGTSRGPHVNKLQSYHPHTMKKCRSERKARRGIIERNSSLKGLCNRLLGATVES